MGLPRRELLEIEKHSITLIKQFRKILLISSISKLFLKIRLSRISEVMCTNF